ncbi:MAG: GNAT family N-acetyltransferase [Planctomycetota bacterium]|jgi:putative acetyltransferase
MDLTISEMTLSDYDEVAALWESAEGVGLSGSDSKQGVGAFLERNPGLSFVARAAGELVGAVMCGHDGRRGYVHHLAVAPTARRRGIGRALVDKCLAELRSIGIQRCHLLAFSTNLSGRHFWEAVGWVARDDLIVMSTDVDAQDS